MKIIAINALSALRGGGQTYIKNLLQHLPEGDFEVLLIVGVANEEVFAPYVGARVKLYVAEWASQSIIHRSLWEKFGLPKKLSEWGAAVYYAPGGVMTTKVPAGCVSATALRNMLPFDEEERKRFPLWSYLRFKFWLLKNVFKKSYRLADKVVFISEYSMSVAEVEVPGVSNKGMVIPHGLNQMFLNGEAMKPLPARLVENRFYLYVSILDVYKAQKEVIRSWKIWVDQGGGYPLVLVGPKYNQYGDEVEALIVELGLEDDVYYLGGLDYEDLPSIYKASRALIFASSCECCPNILLEKMAAGKPVLCSNIQPMPEFGGDAVMYFNPYSETSLSDQVTQLESESTHDEWGQRAHSQALLFDWTKTAKRTFQFLRE